MRHLITLVLLAFSANFATAQENTELQSTPESLIVRPAETEGLNEFLWIKRPLIIFADSPNDPRFVQQLEYISKGASELAERDVIVLTDSDPRSESALRMALRPRGFMLVLIGKDGVKYLRKPFPWDVREISRSIDKLPLRQQEIRDRRRLRN